MKWFKSILTSLGVFLFAHAVSAQSLSDGATKHVDLFTGDFSYEVPLISLPNESGPSVHLSAQYQAGILVNQPSSWIGLGWNLEPGEIRRSVRGIPDDWKNENTVHTKYAPAPLTATENIAGFGTLYMKYHPHDETAEMDLGVDYTGDGHPYFYPNYDQYVVTGMGEIEPRLFDYASFTMKSQSGTQFRNIHQDNDCRTFSNTPEFRFSKSISSTIGTPTTNYRLGNEYVVKPPGTVSNIEYQGNYDVGTNRMVEGSFIQYFTNTSISSFDPTAAQNSMKEKGFLDFKAYSNSAMRDPNEYPADGIGAFQITNADGYVYHYSLPVYQLMESGWMFETDFDDVITSDELLNVLKGKYAVSWKLTAITGPNFKDVNNNGIADEGDFGYWVRYDYGKWNGAHSKTLPRIGYNKNLRTKEFTHVISDRLTQDYYSFENSGSRFEYLTEVYYLNTISSSTHQLLFFKEVKLDDYSDDGVNTPLLRLKRIALIKNEDAHLVSMNAAINSIASLSLNQANTLDVLSYNDYLANKSIYDDISLSATEFTFDYSLAKNYYYNIHTSPSTQDVLFNNTNKLAYRELVNINTPSSHLANSGKLTLKNVNYYGLNNVKASPSIDFDYDLGNQHDNPDFDPNRKDTWGYFLSEYDEDGHRRYQTLTSKDHVAAWSMKKIGLPSGAELQIEYESDEYSRTGKQAWIDLIYVLRHSNRSEQRPESSEILIEPDDQSLFHFLSNKNHYGLNNLYYETIFSDLYSSHRSKKLMGPDLDTYLSNQSLHTNLTFDCEDICLDRADNATESYDQKPDHLTDQFISISVAKMYGGGLRVKSLKVEDPSTGESYITELNYHDGVATHHVDELYQFFKRGSDDRTISESSKVPMVAGLSPRVGYTSVSTIPVGDNQDYNGRITYQFYNNSYNRFQTQKENHWKSTTGHLPYLEKSDVIITHNNYHQSMHGKLQRKEVYDKLDRMVALEKLNYEPYYIGSNAPSVSEAFHLKMVQEWQGPNRILHVLPEEEIIDDHGNVVQIIPGETVVINGTYPSNAETEINMVFRNERKYPRLVSTESYRDGLKYIIQFDNFDPITGEALSVTGEDGITINRQKAHTVSGNQALGSKALDMDNKNMLSSSYLTYDSKGNPTKANFGNSMPVRSFDDNLGAFTTNTINDVWHITETKVSPEKHINLPDSEWKLLSKVTLYNEKGKAIESTAEDGNHNAIYYDIENVRPIATVQNSRYHESAVATLEDPVVGNGLFRTEVGIGSGTVIEDHTANISAHSGKHVLELGAQSTSLNLSRELNNQIDQDKNYYVSLWVHNSIQDIDDISIDVSAYDHLNQTTTSVSTGNEVVRSAGEWILIQSTFNIPAQGIQNPEITVEVTNNGSTAAYLDDFLFKPLEASAMMFVHDPKTGQTTEQLIDGDLLTRFEYDEAGRLINQFRETEDGLKQTSSTTYQYSK